MIMDLKKTIRSIPNWPIKSVTFRDLTTLMKNPKAMKYVCDTLYERYKDERIEKVVAIDARGFVFGAVLAYKLDAGFVPVRKKGKLPASTIQADYTLEYGINTLEIHEDSISKGDRVVIIDDLLATGGTLEAAIKLVDRLEGNIVECAVVVELVDLQGRGKIIGHRVHSMVEFEGE